MKFKIYDYSGIKYQDEIKSLTLINHDGETCILQNHAPIVLTAPKGHLRLEQEGSNTLFVALEQAVVKVLNNEIFVLASFAEIARTKEEASKCYDQAKANRLNLTKQESVQMSELEKDLKENIKKIKAGEI